LIFKGEKTDFSLYFFCIDYLKIGIFGQTLYKRFKYFGYFSNIDIYYTHFRLKTAPFVISIVFY